MTDAELADEIESGELVILALTVPREIKEQIIAALRREPSSEMVICQELVPWLEAWGEDGMDAKFSDGCPTPNAEKCLAFAARIRYLLSTTAETEGRKT